MIRAIKNYIRELKWQRLIGPLNRAEAEALRRCDTRALKAARAAKREFMHTALGWRGRAH